MGCFGRQGDPPRIPHGGPLWLAHWWDASAASAVPTARPAGDCQGVARFRHRGGEGGGRSARGRAGGYDLTPREQVRSEGGLVRNGGTEHRDLARQRPTG